MELLGLPRSSPYLNDRDSLDMLYMYVYIYIYIYIYIYTYIYFFFFFSLFVIFLNFLSL